MPTETKNTRDPRKLFIVLAWFVFTLVAIAVPPLFIVHIVALVVLPFRRRQRKVNLQNKRNQFAEEARQSRGY